VRAMHVLSPFPVALRAAATCAQCMSCRPFVLSPFLSPFRPSVALCRPVLSPSCRPRSVQETQGGTLANPDEARLKAYLADQGVELAGGFDAAMWRVRAKGWVFRTNWKWHVSDKTIHHMR
jgi:hypothetical protein